MNFYPNKDDFLASTNNPGSQIIVDYNWKPNNEIIKEISPDFENNLGNDFEHNLGNDLGNIFATKAKNGNEGNVTMCIPNNAPNNLTWVAENSENLFLHCQTQTTSDACNNSTFVASNYTLSDACIYGTKTDDRLVDAINTTAGLKDALSINDSVIFIYIFEIAAIECEQH